MRLRQHCSLACIPTPTMRLQVLMWRTDCVHGWACDLIMRLMRLLLCLLHLLLCLLMRLLRIRQLLLGTLKLSCECCDLCVGGLVGYVSVNVISTLLTPPPAPPALFMPHNFLMDM